MLGDLCVINDFGFISNYIITTKYFWKDVIYLQDLGTSILSKSFVEFVNKYLFSNPHDHFWLNESHQTNYFYSDIYGLTNRGKAFQNNLLIGYIIINSLREKIISLSEVFSKTPIDILFVDETKPGASFPDHQFKILGYQSPPLRRDRNSKGCGK